MQKYIFLAILFTSISCKQEKKEETENTQKLIALSEPVKEIAFASHLTNFWSGKFDATEEEIKTQKNLFENYYGSLDEVPKKYIPFVYVNPLHGNIEPNGPNALSIDIQTLYTDGSFTGSTICAGNELRLEGEYIDKGNDIFHFEGKEIGDSGVGQLDFVITNGTLIGKWTSDNSGITKSFSLKKIDFDDNKMTSKFPFTDKDLTKEALTSVDIDNLYKPQLRILRNFIFARHGLSFKSKDLRGFFERYDWYIPKKVDVTNDLSIVEQKNVALINRYEKYAEDTFLIFLR